MKIHLPVLLWKEKFQNHLANFNQTLHKIYTAKGFSDTVESFLFMKTSVRGVVKIILFHGDIILWVPYWFLVLQFKTTYYFVKHLCKCIWVRIIREIHEQWSSTDNDDSIMFRWLLRPMGLLFIIFHLKNEFFEVGVFVIYWYLM